MLRFHTMFLALLVAFSAASVLKADEGKSLFNGKDLTGWDGNPDFWTVEDGAITGTTTPEKPTKGNTFIIWKDGKPGDFELNMKFRIVGGNSGIQYRSKDHGKWVVGGYQADFDGAGGWTGTLYEERGRGILAKRGQKVVINAEGKKETVGETTTEKDIVASIKKEDWNDYTIIARGNELIQKVNGLVTVHVTDHEEKKRAMEGILALQLHAGPPMKVQFKDIVLKELKADATQASAKEESAVKESTTENSTPVAVPAVAPSAANGAKKIVFVAGGKSHGWFSHDHKSGCHLLANAIKAAYPGVETVVVEGGWPKDESVFNGASSVLIYADGGGGHPALKGLATYKRLVTEGVGMVHVHYGVGVPKGDGGNAFLDSVGGYFETNWSVNPHWRAEYASMPGHEVTRGVKPFKLQDEWYYHMRFREGMKGVTPLLTAMPPEATLSRKDGAHSGNPDVRAAVLERKEPQHMAWVFDRTQVGGKGRGFGITGAHFHINWAQDDFRTLVLNAIAWTTGLEVPETGTPSKRPTVDDLIANQDEPVPANFDKEATAKKIEEINKAE